MRKSDFVNRKYQMLKVNFLREEPVIQTDALERPRFFIFKFNRLLLVLT